MLKLLDVAQDLAISSYLPPFVPALFLFPTNSFFFKGPHEDANREAHAYNFLLAFVEFLENIYQCIGWPAPKILSWNLHTKATGADRKNAGLVREYGRNAVMKDIVGWVLRQKLEGGRKLQRQLAIKSF